MDDKLEELFDSCDAPQGIDSVDPWRRPFRFLIWGILLTTVSLNFLRLDLILPALGLALMYLGSRPLRRTNWGFTAVYIISAARLLLFYVYHLFLPAVSAALSLISIALGLAVIVALRAGICGVFDAAGVPRATGSVNALLVSEVLLSALAAAGAELSEPIVIVFALLHICAVVSLYLIPRALGDTGYALRNAGVRWGDMPALAVLVLSLALSAFAGWGMWIYRSTPGADVWEEPDTTSLEGRLPDGFLSALTPEDARLLESAGDIQWKSRSPTPFPDGTELHLLTVAAKLPEGHSVAVFQYFEYLEGGPATGDGAAMWAQYPISPTDSLHSQLIYDLEGVTYRSSPLQITTGSIDSPIAALSPGSDDHMFADIYAPAGARNVRGYFSYTFSITPTDILNFNAEITYLHTGGLQTFPGSRPTELLKSGRAEGDYISEHLTLFTEYWE